MVTTLPIITVERRDRPRAVMMRGSGDYEHSMGQLLDFVPNHVGIAVRGISGDGRAGNGAAPGMPLFRLDWEPRNLICATKFFCQF
jgi:hypothetical protein